MESPPGVYSEYQTEDGTITVYARFAVFLENTTPTKVFCFNAESVEVDGVEITPVPRSKQSQADHNHVAEFIGQSTVDSLEDTEVIIYHIEQFNGICSEERIRNITTDQEPPESNLPSIVPYLLLAELHELVHWATNKDEQPRGSDHWEDWNAVLSTEIAYCNDELSWGSQFNIDLSGSEYDVPDLTEPGQVNSETNHQTELWDGLPDRVK